MIEKAADLVGRGDAPGEIEVETARQDSRRRRRGRGEPEWMKGGDPSLIDGVLERRLGLCLPGWILNGENGRTIGTRSERPA